MLLTLKPTILGAMPDRTPGPRRLPAWVPFRPPTGPLRPLVLVAVLGYVVGATLSGLVGVTRFGATLPTWAVALMVLPAFVAALWRYDHPWPVFAVVLVQTLTLAVLIPDYQPIAGALVGLHAIARQRPMREVQIALGLFAVPFLIIVASIGRGNEDDRILTMVSGALIYGAAVFVVVLLGHSQRQARELRATRARAYDAMVDLRLQEDRLVVARDLHDKVANSIAAVVMGLDGMRRTHPDLPPPLDHSMELANASAVLAMKETREILAVLHNDEADLEDEPDLQDLESTLMRMQTMGWAYVDVEVTSIGESVPLSAPLDECATRCVREAVSNAAKYGVSSVSIEVDWREDPFSMVIRNSRSRGRLPDPSLRGGVGLSVIMHLVTEVGGSVSLETDAESFTLRLLLPRR